MWMSKINNGICDFGVENIVFLKELDDLFQNPSSVCLAGYSGAVAVRGSVHVET